jgi:hypothetical protein
VKLYLHFHYTFMVCTGTALLLWKKTSYSLRHIMGWRSPFWVNNIPNVSSVKHVYTQQNTKPKDNKLNFAQ